ncbi:hypothetical protein KK120_18575 [Virgibacillus dakarensis]|nr:hypothetical protein [Virgibacillus dakarensis]
MAFKKIKTKKNIILNDVDSNEILKYIKDLEKRVEKLEKELSKKNKDGMK